MQLVGIGQTRIRVDITAALFKVDVGCVSSIISGAVPVDQGQDWEEIARQICRRHAIEIDRPLLYRRESNPVFIVDDRWVVKIFTPAAERQFAVEATVLRQLAGQRAIPAPRWLADGRIDGSGYVLMTRVEGEKLEKVWPSIAPPQRLHLARETGRILAHFHQLDPSPLSQTERLHGGWRAFCRRFGPKFRQQLPGLDMLPGPLRREITAFLKTEAPAYIDAGPVLVHADIGPGHIYLSRTGNRWRVSGLIDFADAMLAPAEFEWTDGLLYLFPDEAALRWAVLNGYYANRARPVNLERRCLANLMYSYAGARWIEEWHQRAGHPALHTLQDLQDLLFPRPPSAGN